MSNRGGREIRVGVRPSYQCNYFYCTKKMPFN